MPKCFKLAIACAVVGFVVGVISLTGLGLRMADIILRCQQITFI